MNPCNGSLQKTTYNKLERITGMTKNNLYSMKCIKRGLKCLNGYYIVDINISKEEKKEYLKKYSPKLEIWREINLNDFSILPKKQRYYVSDLGRVKAVYSSGKEKILSQYTKHNKKLLVCKIVDKEISIHKLVAKYFLDNPTDKNMVIYHKDGDICNNDSENLGWIDRKTLGKKTGGGANAMGVLKVDSNTGEILDFYESMSQAGRENYIHKETIRLAIKGSLLTAGGYKWILENEDIEEE